MEAKKILIIVDMQKDFVNGSLGSQEAQAIVSAVEKKLADFQGEVIFTRDTHQEDYMDTQEGRMLPVKHCIEHTEGWELIDSLQQYAQEHHCKIYNKPTFGCLELAIDIQKAYDKGEVKEVQLIGVCTDICVVSNALMLKAYMPELPISIDAACCAGVTPVKHEAALETMRSCQIQVNA